ncbi:hypothetical protein BU17DRAFT_70934 [Hysterangium stoloniferum]|nr:hypothetical protein BU17DRAFT_70934 [Hysterangium stoloniferum]
MSLNGIVTELRLEAGPLELTYEMEDTALRYGVSGLQRIHPRPAHRSGMTVKIGNKESTLRRWGSRSLVRVVGKLRSVYQRERLAIVRSQFNRLLGGTHNRLIKASSHPSGHHSSVVGTHYKVGKKIGEGSFGVVFEGTNLLNGAPVGEQFEFGK